MKILGFHRIVASLAMAFALVVGVQPALAQEAAEATATTQLESVDPAEAADVADADAVAEGAGAYTPMKPTEGIGMPVDRGLDIQPQFSETGEFAYGLHVGLIWVMVGISVFVLVLLLYTVFRFRRKANPVPSKTSHNTLIEV
ncbi:MAG: cytochrome c oxidase subunit II, partial [Sphingomonadales bacterium]